MAEAKHYAGKYSSESIIVLNEDKIDWDDPRIIAGIAAMRKSFPQNDEAWLNMAKGEIRDLNNKLRYRRELLIMLIPELIKHAALRFDA